ncbi:hypothetical protein BCL90_0009 [Pedobacter alluvionis]|uniref:Transposase n=1 Tax=Pedobacter alluvionis TaxID=475253 RepID=A0A497YEF9_9SPHI|nr:hypothetical protein BCL90_0009 [Pedobacter alluvionis]
MVLKNLRNWKFAANFPQTTGYRNKLEKQFTEIAPIFSDCIHKISEFKKAITYHNLKLGL